MVRKLDIDVLTPKIDKGVATVRGNYYSNQLRNVFLALWGFPAISVSLNFIITELATINK